MGYLEQCSVFNNNPFSEHILLQKCYIDDFLLWRVPLSKLDQFVLYLNMSPISSLWKIVPSKYRSWIPKCVLTFDFNDSLQMKTVSFMPQVPIPPLWKKVCHFLSLLDWNTSGLHLMIWKVRLAICILTSNRGLIWQAGWMPLWKKSPPHGCQSAPPAKILLKKKLSSAPPLRAKILKTSSRNTGMFFLLIQSVRSCSLTCPSLPITEPGTYRTTLYELCPTRSYAYYYGRFNWNIYSVWNPRRIF